MGTRYRALPSVDQLLKQVRADSDAAGWPHDLVVEAARVVLEEAREEIGAGAEAPSLDEISTVLLDRLRRWTRPTLRPVINASGVILQTNMGRAPLSQAALQSVHDVAVGYSNLEYDLGAGERGSRHDHARDLLCRLTGAEAALVVNNNAAAVLLSLSALARGREVVISRGQAVEIGGGFRIPDVLRQSGARLVEVGTTNRTYLRDYEAAVGEATAALMRVHRSNFALIGFTHDVALDSLVRLARDRGVYLIDDLGSGTLLDTTPFGLAREPTVQESVAAGVDLVCFSGDKLLGGPQAGLIVGRAEAVARLRNHPLARALRPDKTAFAALEATLLHYLREEALAEIPVWQMISLSPEDLRRRGRRWQRWLAQRELAVQLVESETAVGGGSLPGQGLPSWALAIAGLSSADAAARHLRHGDPPIVCRIEEGELIFDLRTVLAHQEGAFLEGLLSLRPWLAEPREAIA